MADETTVADLIAALLEVDQHLVVQIDSPCLCGPDHVESFLAIKYDDTTAVIVAGSKNTCRTFNERNVTA